MLLVYIHIDLFIFLCSIEEQMKRKKTGPYRIITSGLIIMIVLGTGIPVHKHSPFIHALILEPQRPLNDIECVLTVLPIALDLF